jgi:hypothetical protein
LCSGGVITTNRNINFNFNLSRESISNNRTRLEETTDPTPHGDQGLHVQQ